MHLLSYLLDKTPINTPHVSIFCLVFGEAIDTRVDTKSGLIFICRSGLPPSVLAVNLVNSADRRLNLCSVDVIDVVSGTFGGRGGPVSILLKELLLIGRSFLSSGYELNCEIGALGGNLRVRSNLG